MTHDYSAYVKATRLESPLFLSAEAAYGWDCGVEAAIAIVEAQGVVDLGGTFLRAPEYRKRLLAALNAR